MFSKDVPPNENLSDYLTVGEAAKFLGISPATLRNWDKAGKLLPYRHPLNNYRLYKQSDLEALLMNVKQQNVSK